MKDKKESSIKINFIMNAILNMSSFIFPLITFPYVSRVLLPAGTGKVSFAISLIAYFNMIAQLGIPTYGIRACAKLRDDRAALSRVANELLCINLIMAFVSYIVLGLALAFVPRLFEDRMLYLIVSSNIILTAIGMEWLYKALEQYKYITVRSVIFKFAALALMFAIVRSEGDYVWYGLVTVVSASVSFIFNFINAGKYIDINLFKKYDLKKHIKPALVFFAMACATVVYTNLDTVMLGFMQDDTQVGYYHAAVRIKTILVSIVTSLGGVLLPRLSYYVEKGMMEEFRRISKKAMNFVIVFALSLAVYFIIYAKQGIYFLSGSAFDGAILPMQIIMPTLVLIGLTNIIGIQMLVPMGKEKAVLYSVAAGAFADIILNAILIPHYAAAGAAAGTLVAEVVVLAVQYNALKEEVSEALKDILYLKLLIALVIASVTAIGIKGLHLGNFASLLISAILFYGLYLGLLAMMKEPMINEILVQICAKLKRR